MVSERILVTTKLRALKKNYHINLVKVLFSMILILTRNLLYIHSTPVESEALLTPDVPSTDQSLGLHKSSRQSLQYKSNQAGRKYICNKDPYVMGKLDHLQNISL